MEYKKLKLPITNHIARAEIKVVTGIIQDTALMVLKIGSSEGRPLEKMLIVGSKFISQFVTLKKKVNIDSKIMLIHLLIKTTKYFLK